MDAGMQQMNFDSFMMIQVGVAIGQIVFLGGFVMWFTKRSLAKLETLRIDMEVVKTQIGQALDLRSDVKSDHDCLIRLDERIKKNKMDLDFLHQKTRDLMKQIITSNHGG